MNGIALGQPLYSTFAGMPKSACFEDGMYLRGDEDESNVQQTKVSSSTQSQTNVVDNLSKSLASTVSHENFHE
jgi:hypothetical protein